MTFLVHSKSLPIPAGVLAVSPLLDVTGSFPSPRVDTGLDWLPCLWKTPFVPKPSQIWPPSKPRFDFYTDIPLHPLVLLSIANADYKVSPVLVAGELPPCPPLFVVVGDNELLRDEVRMLRLILC